MVFHSLEFAIFLPIVFILYWLVHQYRYLQNVIIVIASLFFYGWWDWRFLWLILFTSILDYFVGIALNRLQSKNQRKLLLTISVVANLSLLGLFKYYNFFIDSFNTAFTILGAPLSIRRLNIILPVGISFYTFQTMSYTIDVYRKQLEPTKDVVSFLAFVSFFPQLVAGPIERATNLLPQFLANRIFSYQEARLGLRQILWGLFKKVAVADTCAIIADKIFANYSYAKVSVLYVGVLCFAIQIYADFSAYSDIAIGSARLFGFRLMQNFKTPFFSRSVAEFWRRWHISLSTWFRDYVYIPLGGSRIGRLNYIRNILIVFFLTGLWHGANWTFITWGLWQTVFIIPFSFLNRQEEQAGIYDLISKSNSLTFWSYALNAGKVFITFQIFLLGSIFFRSETLVDAWLYLKVMLSSSLFSKQTNFSVLINLGDEPFLLATISLFIAEWFTRDKSFPLESLETSLPRVLRWLLYALLCFTIIYFSKPEQNTQFIYFQF